MTNHNNDEDVHRLYVCAAKPFACAATILKRLSEVSQRPH